MSLPSQAKYIVGNEACERFSFYGMRSILMVFMTSELLMTEESSQSIFHLFVAILYFTPLIGAWLADRFWGRYNTILSISLFYCFGHGVLALSDLTHDIETRRAILLAGLAIIAVGAGGIKPCVSAFVGDQMKDCSPAKITKMYSIFYWSINLGSFFAFLVIPYTSKTYGYGLAFGIPGIFMALATFIFWMGRKKYEHVAAAEPHFFPAIFSWMRKGKQSIAIKYGEECLKQTISTLRQIAIILGLLPPIILIGYLINQGISQILLAHGLKNLELASSTINLCYGIAVMLAVLKWASMRALPGFFGIVGSMLFNRQQLPEISNPEQRKSCRNLLRILAIFSLVIPFWSLYDQTGSSWIIQGKEMQPIIIHAMGGYSFGAEEMQSINPLLVMSLIPLLTLYLYPYIGKWANPIKRMSLGILLSGSSFLVVAWFQMRMDAGEQLSILWQILPYSLLTLSEILVSATGIEYAYTAAGKKLKSIVSSLWLLSITAANILVIALTSIVEDAASASTFLLYGSLAFIVGLIFLLVTTRRVMQPEPLDE